MELVGYFCLIFIGIILSLIGGGGSILSIPILVYLFSLDVVTASSYSLFIVGTTSLVGVWLRQKEHRMDIRAGIIFSMCSAIAIFCMRTWIIPAIPDEFLVNNLVVTKRSLILGIFVCLSVASALTILLKKDQPSQNGGPSRPKLLIPAGFGTGLLVGFVGAGGGFLVLPALTLFAGLPFKIAIGTTLLVIGINSLLGFLGDVMNYEINWIFLLLITGLASSGMFLGNFYSSRIKTRYLRESFGWIILTIAVCMLFKELVL